MFFFHDRFATYPVTSRLGVIAMALVGLHVNVFGQEVAGKPVAPVDSKAVPKTVTAIQETIQGEVVMSGVFVARQVYEISVAVKKMQPLVIVQIAEHGQRVQKGEVILRLETTKLDEMIADQQSTVALSELSLQEAESQLRVATEREPLTKEQMELTKRYADEDFKRFQEIDHPFAIRAAEQSLRMARQGLEYTEEELKQLEQMYKADDLTEQTEEIILRRARNDVDRSRFYFEQSQKEHEKSTKVTQPRNARQQENAHRLAELAYQQSVVTQSVEINRQRVALEKTKIEHQRAIKTLAELRQDRRLVVVKSPISGVVYYGRASDGKWPPVAELARRMKPHGTITPHEEFLSIVDNESLEFLGKMAEAELKKVQQGSAGRLTPTAHPSERLTARVRLVDDIPVSDGQYLVTVDVETTRQHHLVAGMTGTAKFTTYVNAKAIVIPAKVVFTDPSDDTRRFVYVLDSNGRGERRDCTTGITAGDRVEIVAGISAGEQVLEEKPKP